MPRNESRDALLGRVTLSCVSAGVWPLLAVAAFADAVGRWLS